MEQEKIKLTYLQIQISELANELNTVVDQQLHSSYYLERLSKWLFAGLVFCIAFTIFFQFWIAVLSIIAGITLSAILIYKSKANFSDQVEINMWLAERCRKLSIKCSEIEKREIELCTHECEFSFEISVCLNSFQRIKEDRAAHVSRVFTTSLQEYYEGIYQRDKYASALKNS